jgi:uncharacterized protein
MNTDSIFDGEQLDLPSTSIKQKTKIANTFLTAMKTNDWELMRSVMNDDVEWTLPGQSVLSGPAIGINAVINRAQSLKKFGVMFQLINILYGWHGVALLLHNTGKRENLELDETVTIAFQLDGEKITSIATYLSDVQGIEQFFVPGVIEVNNS